MLIVTSSKYQEIHYLQKVAGKLCRHFLSWIWIWTEAEQRSNKTEKKNQHQITFYLFDGGSLDLCQNSQAESAKQHFCLIIKFIIIKHLIEGVALVTVLKNRNHNMNKTGKVSLSLQHMNCWWLDKRSVSSLNRKSCDVLHVLKPRVLPVTTYSVIYLIQHMHMMWWCSQKGV